MAIVNRLKEDEDLAWMHEILDSRDMSRRVLLPLYVASEIDPSAEGLTSGYISRIYTELGVRIAQANVSRGFRERRKNTSWLTRFGARVLLCDTKSREQVARTWSNNAGVPSPDAHTARALTHAQLGRVDQVIGMIWSAYPLEADFDTCLDLLEAEGLSNQNRPRLRRSLRASRLVSQGKTTGSYRINPRYTEFLTAKYAPIVGAPKQISVHDEQAVIPAGTIPLDRKYIKEIVRRSTRGTLRVTMTRPL